MKDADEERQVQPNRATVDSEFLRHPASGAFFRNPLREKKGAAPIVLSAGEYDFNCLDEALSEWNCITVRESSLKDLLVGPGLPSPMSPTKSLTSSWASIGKIKDLPQGYDFVMSIRKSSYSAPRARGRGSEKNVPAGSTLVEKANFAVSEAAGGSKLRIDWISPLGLVSEWNVSHQNLSVKPGDFIVGVNNKRNSAAMLEELKGDADLLRIQVHHDGDVRGSRVGSKNIGPYADPAMNAESLFPAGTLASPDRKASKRR